MKCIELTKGQVAIVDDEDFEYLAQWRWYYHKEHYAARGVNKSGKMRCILMHREIIKPPKDVDVDHRNGDGLDNRRVNLRPATRRQNRCNTGKTSRNRSGFKGVHWSKGSQKFCAQIRLYGKCKHLGYFESPEAAALAYNAAAIELHGEFARLN